MRKLVAALILVPLGLLLVALAVVNRKQVVLGLNPFDANAGFGIEAPLFLFLLGAFALGLVVGGIATWLGQGKWAENGAGRSPRGLDLAPPGRPPGEGAGRPRLPPTAARAPAGGIAGRSQKSETRNSKMSRSKF